MRNAHPTDDDVIPGPKGVDVESLADSQVHGFAPDQLLANSDFRDP
jgi:hypothetical protein